MYVHNSVFTHLADGCFFLSRTRTESGLWLDTVEPIIVLYVRYYCAVERVLEVSCLPTDSSSGTLLAEHTAYRK